jgi:hypothetical protein
MSPSASVRAFLHSIIGASVFARSSATMLAVIAAIRKSPFGNVKRAVRWPVGPPAPPVGGSGLLANLDELVAFGCDSRDLGHDL